MSESGREVEPPPAGVESPVQVDEPQKTKSILKRPSPITLDLEDIENESNSIAKTPR